MFEIPSKGFSRSDAAHNVDIGICCDWLEASSLFLQQEISGSDLVDIFRENEIYDEQDFAWEFVNNLFSLVQQRARLIGDGYPFEVHDKARLVPKDEWQRYVPYAFCLVLSLPRAYPDWAKAYGANFTQQGKLFEILTAESMMVTLSGWTVHPTGWTRTRTVKLSTVVADVALRLGEGTGHLIRWTAEKAKDAGLDLLCFLPFPDGRVGVPVFLFQCASGSDWKRKLKTPDLRIWTKIITFASDPKKAISIPFALEEEDFVRYCNIVDGFLVDRYRLLTPGTKKRDWLSDDLEVKLVAWITPRAANLPRP